MNIRNENALELADSKGVNKATSKTNNSKIRKGTKLHSVISYLVGGNTLHRFQAEKVVRDHTLPSTVSGFQRTTGIMVARKLITVPGYQGAPTAVALYWLEAEERVRAKKLLEAA